MSLCPVGELDILRQILDGATAHGLAEVVAGDLGQLVRLVEDIDLRLGTSSPKPVSLTAMSAKRDGG